MIYQLGPDSRHAARYKITAQIGEREMGAVYRATDTSLDRRVAIKVLTRSPLVLNAVRQWKYEPTVVNGNRPKWSSRSR